MSDVPPDAPDGPAAPDAPDVPVDQEQSQPPEAQAAGAKAKRRPRRSGREPSRPPEEQRAGAKAKRRQDRSGHAGRRWPSARVLQWVIVALLIAGGVSFVVKGADGPKDPSFQSGARTPVAGFGEIAYRVNRTAQASRCALLAQTSQQHNQGLMNRRDLAGYDGMLFVFPADTQSSFYMKDTPLPLSIAWFDSAGRFVSSTDMEPCLVRPDCPLYSATGTYRYALEVQKGGLAALGVGPGAVISVGGPCA